jgi:hypothetical protein
MLPMPPRTAAVKALMLGTKTHKEGNLAEDQGVQHARHAGENTLRTKVVTMALSTLIPIRAATSLS